MRTERGFHVFEGPTAAVSTPASACERPSVATGCALFVQQRKDIALDE